MRGRGLPWNQGKKTAFNSISIVEHFSGKEFIFDKGSLAKALRASSSIPSVFSPVINDKFLLVDGGVSSTF